MYYWVSDIWLGLYEKNRKTSIEHTELYSTRGPSPSTAAGDSGGERQGHCMKHEAVTGALVKWLLSWADG